MKIIEIENFLSNVCESVLLDEFEQGFEQENYKDLPFNELGFDSIDTIEIVVSIEEKFKIKLNPDVLFKNQTISSLSKYIKEALSD